MLDEYGRGLLGQWIIGVITGILLVYIVYRFVEWDAAKNEDIQSLKDTVKSLGFANELRRHEINDLKTVKEVPI